MHGAAARERIDIPSVRPGHATRRSHAALLVVLAVAFAAVRWYPITRNYFFADDFLNLYEIVDVPLRQYLVTPNGGHVLLTRNAVFYLTWLVAGTDPRPYYWSVLLTHLLNVALLFGVIRGMTSSLLLAALGAALWGTSPLSEGTLGWYSVYGQVLVATAVLVILHQALRADAPPGKATRALWFVLALAAANAFGSGTAIALVLPLVLWLVMAPKARPRRPPLLSLLVAVPALYVAQVAFYQHLSGVDMYKGSTLLALVSDIVGIVRFWTGMIAFGVTRLVAGPVPIGPRAVWFAVLAAFGLAVVAAARASEATGRRRIVAWTLLVVTAYGIIALGRGALTTWIAGGTRDAVPLVPRYHYVGQLCLTFLLMAVAARAVDRFPRRATGAVLAIWGVAVLAAHGVWGTPVDNHDDARAGTRAAIDAMGAVIASAPRGAPVYIRNSAVVHMPFVPSDFPGAAALFTVFFPANVVDGHRVYFIEANPALFRAVRSRRRTATLLVPPFLGQGHGGV